MGNNNDDDDYFPTQNNADDDFASHAYRMDVESKETSSLYFILFATLLFAVLIMSKYLHEAPAINKYLSEASLILIVGLIASFLTETFIQYEEKYYVDYDEEEDYAFQRLISFSPNIFFMALLPPILFNSGYQLRRELFLRHIYPIVMFAVMGTIASSIICAMTLWGFQQLGLYSAFDPTLLELFAFGSLIAATDTVSVIAVLQAKRVDPHLFYVVFGESALNDAVALVLYNSFADLLRANKEYSYESFIAFFPEFLIDAVGSPLLGILFGFGAALLFKAVDLRKKKYRMLELSLYLMLMYVPFIIAESMHLSGIVAIFFAGLSVRRYVAPNVSRVTEKAGATIFQLVAFLSETCIFLELGLSIFGFSGSFNWDFIFYSLFACLLARGISIYPLALLHNFAVTKEEEAEMHNLQQSGQFATVDENQPQNVAMPSQMPTTFAPAQQPPLHEDIAAVESIPITTTPPQTYVPPTAAPAEPAVSAVAPTPAAATPAIPSAQPATIAVPAPTPAVPPTTTATPVVPDIVQPTPMAHNLHITPPVHIGGSGLAAPSTSPLNEEHPATDPVRQAVPPAPPVNQGFSRRVGNSFDTEDTRGSFTTVTTHQSRKRRERRGRLMDNVKKERITWEMMHILWFAGLRGAVAYACVREFPDLHGNADEFTAATMFIVLFTIVIMGGLTESLLGWLGIEMGVDLEEYMDIFRQEQELSGTFHDWEQKYLFDVATRKPPEKRSESPSPQNQPPVFLGVDSNAFHSMNSEQDYYNWAGFEMQCFPGYDNFADDVPSHPPVSLHVTPGALTRAGYAMHVANLPNIT